MTSMQIPGLEIDDAPKAVFTWLRDMIVSWPLLAGDQVKIRAIADKMRISIVPVREAIRMLLTEGLMELRPRRSPIVVPLELSEILKINNIRLALEPVFLERAVDAHTGASIAKCRALIDADKASTDYNEKVNLNRQFHPALLEPAAQPRALKTVHGQFEISPALHKFPSCAALTRYAATCTTSIWRFSKRSPRKRRTGPWT